KKALGRGEIGDVRRDLSRVDRVARKALLLASLDLAVPVGALDEADLEPPPCAPGEIREIVDERQDALLIRLNREAEPFPAGEPRLERERLEDIEREVQ